MPNSTVLDAVPPGLRTLTRIVGLLHLGWVVRVLPHAVPERQWAAYDRALLTAEEITCGFRVALFAPTVAALELSPAAEFAYRERAGW
ncbi:hypothetical protein SAMN05421803_11221 [Nocardiopsis flavescens]|uniref:Uncharacterized protein n=1 Tax=Nocardiopsis flavescens TaxID=758803 RepID=A0A1M6NN07_9ACTN|nr:hypothetical protein [Nocardiopsis flavescens]SHJ97137.1 hypothetical protein SAMN05421803_11221 [Nocardiopsis flavescens]